MSHLWVPARGSSGAVDALSACRLGSAWAQGGRPRLASEHESAPLASAGKA